MLITAEDPLTDERHEVVIKLGPDVQSGRMGLATESICAALAFPLGLKAARGWTVEITPDFAASVPDFKARERLTRAVGPQFGSTFHSGQYHVPLTDDHLEADLMDPAAAVMLFDAMIGNDDRHRNKPNCLLKGADIILIDHERALPGLRAEFRPAAWESGGLELFRNHAFFNGLRGQLPDFTSPCLLWANITAKMAEQIVSDVPTLWMDGCERRKAIDFLVEMQNNASRVSGLLTDLLR